MLTPDPAAGTRENKVPVPEAPTNNNQPLTQPAEHNQPDELKPLTSRASSMHCTHSSTAQHSFIRNPARGPVP